MANLFFFELPRCIEQISADEASLADAVVHGIEFHTDEEYLALSGAMMHILRGKVIKGSHWFAELGSLGLWDETDEYGKRYTYVEVSFGGDLVRRFPPSLLARFDQEVAESYDSREN